MNMSLLIWRCHTLFSGKFGSAELPAFSTCLSNVMVRAGQKLKLECTVTGKPFPSLSWFHNGKPLKELPNIIVIILILLLVVEKLVFMTFVCFI